MRLAASIYVLLFAGAMLHTAIFNSNTHDENGRYIRPWLILMCTGNFLFTLLLTQR